MLGSQQRWMGKTIDTNLVDPTETVSFDKLAIESML